MTLGSQLANSRSPFKRKQTYTLESNGKPVLVFRAANDGVAARWPTHGVIGRHWVQSYGWRNLRVRPATIPERAAWTQQATDMCIETNPDIGEPDYDADSYAFLLGAVTKT